MLIHEHIAEVVNAGLHVSRMLGQSSSGMQKAEIGKCDLPKTPFFVSHTGVGFTGYYADINEATDRFLAMTDPIGTLWGTV